MSTLTQIILATTLISLMSLVGVLFLTLKSATYSRYLILLVSLSAGTLLGGAFLHLLPEATQNATSSSIYATVLTAFITFFIIEKVLHWHHCHSGNCDNHTEGYMNLIGDALHNLLDGIVIAAAFTTSTQLGVATTLAVALHEIPQEISDLGVLLHYGFSKTTALLYNFIVAAFSIAGGILGYLWISQVQNITNTILIPFAAGGFIYIAASDLVPEIKKEDNLTKSLASVAMFVLGVGLMWVLKGLE